MAGHSEGNTRRRDADFRKQAGSQFHRVQAVTCRIASSRPAGFLPASLCFSPAEVALPASHSHWIATYHGTKPLLSGTPSCLAWLASPDNHGAYSCMQEQQPERRVQQAMDAKLAAQVRSKLACRTKAQLPPHACICHYRPDADLCLLGGAASTLTSRSSMRSGKCGAGRGRRRPTPWSWSAFSKSSRSCSSRSDAVHGAWMITA